MFKVALPDNLNQIERGEIVEWWQAVFCQKGKETERLGSLHQLVIAPIQLQRYDCGGKVRWRSGVGEACKQSKWGQNSTCECLIAALFSAVAGTAFFPLERVSLTRIGF